MTEEPVVLPTSVGPVAAIFTIPDGPPKATVVIVPGSGGTRAGVNGVWVRVARSARENGVATLRADYAGMGESWDADPHQRSAGIRDLARWACERTNDVPLLLVANCFGLSPALSVCRERAVAGTALMLPPVFPARSLERPPELRQTVNERIQTRLGQVRALPRRIAYRVRYGSAYQVVWSEQAERGHPIKDLSELVSLTPTWLLMGSKDNCTDPVRELLPRLQERGDVDLTVIDGLGLRAATTPETQDAICDNIVAWLARSVARVDAPT
jgi:alpha/beta superfamily hydrolase